MSESTAGTIGYEAEETMQQLMGLFAKKQRAVSNG